MKLDYVKNTHTLIYMSNSGLREKKNRNIPRQWKEVYFVILRTRDFSLPTFYFVNEYIHSEINQLIIMPVQPMKRSTNSGEWNMFYSWNMYLSILHHFPSS